MTSSEDSFGRGGFAERHGLWTDAHEQAASRLPGEIEKSGVEILRLSFVDQHGVLRGKAINASDVIGVLRNGCTMTSSLLAKDTSHKTAYPVFTQGAGFGIPEMEGAGDIIMLPDPDSFRVLPWAPKTGWMLCDIHFANGQPIPFSTREIGRSAFGLLDEHGYGLTCGIEVEFNVFKLDDPKLSPAQAGQPPDPPEVSLVSRGFQYQTESKLDELDPIFQLLRRDLLDLELPVRSMEVEFGPSQLELTFHPISGLAAADAMVLFRSSVKQICRRQGYHATFMCRPALPNLVSNGWHLHQCLTRRDTGESLFMPTASDASLSDIGLHYLGGLLEHAREASVFTTPTINGYKRYQPNTLAPDRIAWGIDNKGAMLRVVGGAEDPGSRIENRIGEPAANPYLYIASQIVAGLDGIARKQDPGPPSHTPYASDAEPLPASLMDAVAALRNSRFYRHSFGDAFVDYLVTLKEFEISRFLTTVTDWEHREYFDAF